MRWGGMFESIQQDDVWAQTEQEKGHITGRPRSVRARPSLRDPEFVAIVAVVGMVTPLNNSSLQMNSIGFYQLFKLLVTPGIVVLESVGQ